MQKPKFIIFLLMMVLVAGCQGRPAIQNPDLDHYRNGKFVNLYKPVYGYGYHQSELDEIEYLNPDEIEKKHYTFIYAYEPAKQINRTKNYDPALFQIKPDMASLAHSGNNIRVTWLGHACFLIQFPDGTNILTDPVLGEMDGAAGFTASVFDADISLLLPGRSSRTGRCSASCRRSGLRCLYSLGLWHLYPGA
jgi:hypothetical protein